MSLLILFNYIDIFIYSWLFRSIASIKNVKTSHMLITFVIQRSLITIINIFFNIAIFNTIVSIISLSICFYYLSKHLGFSIELACYIVMLNMLSEEIIYYFIAIVFNMDINKLPPWYLFVSLLTIRVVFILTLYFFIKLNSNVFIIKLPYKYWAINITFPILSIALIHFLASLFPFGVHLPYRAEYAIIMVAFNAFLLLINNAVISKFYRDTSLMQKQIDLYNRHIQMQEEKQRRIRSIKHDLKSTIIMIIDLLQNDDIDGAKTKLKQQLHRITDTEYLLKTGITAIDSILNYRAEEAHTSNIRLVLEHNIKEDITIDPFEVGYILGNLIDNAIDAVKEMENTNDSIITIKLSITMNMIYIEVINPYHKSDDLILDSAFFKTNKKDDDNHGLGLTIIESIVKSHKGTFTLTRTDNTVTATIYMYQYI